MPLHRWHHHIKSPLRRRFLKLGFLSILSLMGVFLYQQSALAFSAQQMLERSGNLSLSYFGFGLFSGSLLVIESRRLKPFLLKWLLLIVLLTAIGWVSNYYLRDLYTAPLWLPALSGFGIGTVVVGGWWWGYRQGYCYAIAKSLFRRNHNDPILTDLIEHHAPEYANSDLSMNTLQLIQYTAAAVRYRRLLSRSAFQTLSSLIHNQIRQDTKAERAAQRTAEQEQEQTKIRELISRADNLCN